MTQARELSEMMRQTSVADSSQSHRKRKTHDDESDDEITYLWTMETVKRRRVRSSVPRKSVRDELAADDHRREGSVSSGRLPVSGVLSREVRAKLLGPFLIIVVLCGADKQRCTSSIHCQRSLGKVGRRSAKRPVRGERIMISPGSIWRKRERRFLE